MSYAYLSLQNALFFGFLCIYLSIYLCITICIYLHSLSVGSGGLDRLAKCALAQLSIYLPIYLSIYLCNYLYLLIWFESGYRWPWPPCQMRPRPAIHIFAYLPIYLYTYISIYVKIYITYMIWEWVAGALTYLSTPRFIYYLFIYLSTYYITNYLLDLSGWRWPCPPCRIYLSIYLSM